MQDIEESMDLNKVEEKINRNDDPHVSENIWNQRSVDVIENEPQPIPDNSPFHLFLYFYLFFASELVLRVILGFIIL